LMAMNGQCVQVHGLNTPYRSLKRDIIFGNVT
jgi:hypothetical protein